MSFLNDELAQEIHDEMSEELQEGTLRQETIGALDSYGDPTGSTFTTYDFRGFRSDFSEFSRANGIPESDCKINIIAKSCTAEPKQDDQALLNGQWFHLVKLHKLDPATAMYEFQAQEIEDPTV